MIGAQVYYRNCGFVHFTEEMEVKMITYILFNYAKKVNKQEVFQRWPEFQIQPGNWAIVTTVIIDICLGILIALILKWLM